MTAVAHNDLDKLLADMHAGQLAPEDFAEGLMGQQVFLPVKDEKHAIAGFQRSTKAEPLVVEDDDGNRVLVVFSVPERAKDFLTHYPGYSGGLVAEFPWVLRRVGAGMGLSINPGEELGFDFDSDMLAMLMTLLPEETQ